MKKYFYILLLILPFVLEAQESNEFHNRKFWATNPTVQDIKDLAAAGNSPTALTNSGFDATVYAINSNAPYETIEYLLSLEGNPVNKYTHDGRNYLMWATNKGNIPLMKMLLAKNSRTDILDDHGYNLMAFAAAGGQQNPEVYDLILANGGKIDDTNRAGANALLLLAPNITDDAIIEYFQQKGLTIHTTDHNGNGMFNYAARQGKIDLMKKYIKMGLKYDITNKLGENALFMATYGRRGSTNSIETFTYLDQLGLEANIVNKEGKTPLHNLARGVKEDEVVKFFTDKGVDIQKIDEEGNTFFLNAVGGRNYEMAKKHMPSNINHQNKQGYSALTYAIQNYSPEFSQFLIDNGANPHIKDANGQPLMFHVFHSFSENKKQEFNQILSLLKSKGVDVKEDVSEGQTLLHLAVEEEQEFLVKKALELGVAINSKNKDGLTPLHIAAMKAKSVDMIQLIMENGGKKEILTDFDESPYELALENELLNQSGINLDFLK